MTHFLYGLLPSYRRFWFCSILFCLFSLVAGAQGNRKPKITGQAPLSTYEDQSITIQLINLAVEDRDDWFYPWGFTMTLYPGTGYTLEGHVVKPELNFSGRLFVPATVNDGEDNSNPYNLEIEVHPVNDKPVIAGHGVLSTNENESIAISLQHFTVTDVDNTYPDGFTHKVLPGNNYTTDGVTVAPNPNFTGVLVVNVTVNDGALDSDTYALPIQVKPINRIPEIVGQTTELQVNEDGSISIQLSQINVSDNDSKYPEGFSLALSAGPNYTLSNNIITPVRDFSGTLSVPVTVNDGKNTSKPFNLTITVTPLNDLPVLLNLETEPLFYGFGNLTTPVTQTISITEVDGDSIMFAEVGLRSEGYIAGFDKLVYTAPANSKIKGVFDPGTGILTLLGQASPSSYTKALRSIAYNSLPDARSVNKTIFFTLNDGKSNSETVTRGLVFGEAAVSLEIPSGFTPNGDASNDTWKIIPLKTSDDNSKARIRVYNKAGQIVYESLGFKSEWDGRMNGELLPSDTYFYTIDLNMRTPQSYVKGIVTILR